MKGRTWVGSEMKVGVIGVGNRDFHPPPVAHQPIQLLDNGEEHLGFLAEMLEHVMGGEFLDRILL
jgi:hypothetical protein